MIEILSCLWKPSFLLDVKMVCHVSLFPNLANLNVIMPMKPIFACRFQSGMSCLNQTKTHKASLYGTPICKSWCPLHDFILKPYWLSDFKMEGVAKTVLRMSNRKKKTFNIVHFLFTFFILLSCSNGKSCWHQQAIKLKLFVNNVFFDCFIVKLAVYKSQ
jgi:hypothetical protein